MSNVKVNGIDRFPSVPDHIFHSYKPDFCPSGNLPSPFPIADSSGNIIF